MSGFSVRRNVANVYREPSTSSETVTQAIFGEIVRVIGEADGMCHITLPDTYTGWIRADALLPTYDDGDFLKTSIATLFAEIFSEPAIESELIVKFCVGSRVTLAQRPSVGDFIPILLTQDKVAYIHRMCLDISHEPKAGIDAIAAPSTDMPLDIASLKRRVLEAVGEHTVEVGKRLIGTPYLWGGVTPFGIDCSGFVQLSYRLSGVQLLRDAYQQFADRRFARCDDGRSLENAILAPGDLLAFQREGVSRITHIGMAIGDGRFIHSSGDQGVNVEDCTSERYGATFQGAVRLSSDADLAIEAA
ncbi:MAG: C40 family peptidase [Capsulimonas sp.]|uniref:C40 family peptidase n=1 Tax=Capsulimonas sp. TaxID=2494211 RepID=UPI0032636E58